MARNSGVEWAGASFNPWLGCSKISPGCKHCYAVTDTPVRVHRARGLELWGAGAPRHVTASAYWRAPMAWDRAAAAAGAPMRVFCGPDCDAFEVADGRRLVGDVGGDARPWRTLDDVRAALWALVESTPHLIWMLTTKRIENVRRMVPARWFKPDGWPRNVWILCTVEDAERAAERLPILRELPAPVRGVSFEPALSSVDWPAYLRCDGGGEYGHGLSRTVVHAGGCCRRARAFDWLIAGGERGPRPPHPGWFREAREACRAAAVPFFFKQWGDWLPLGDAGPEHSGAPRADVWWGQEGAPDDLPLLTFRVGKKRAGRLLDGAEHSEVPAHG